MKKNILMSFLALSLLSSCKSEPEKPRNYYGTYDASNDSKNKNGIISWVFSVIIIGGVAIYFGKKLKEK